MARFNPNHPAEPVLDAAKTWLQRCWLADSSVFTGESLWNLDRLTDLKRHFIEQPDESDKSFYEKLQGQLESAAPESRRLMAELLWVLMLFQSNISEEKKRRHIRTVWHWGGVELPLDNPMLTDAVLGGLGSPGVAFNTQRWRELAYLINASIAFKNLSVSTRQETLADPWKFSAWLAGVQDEGHRQLRHMLRHFAFPDTFERITVGADKRSIISAFENIERKELRKWPDEQLDRALLKLRDRLAAELGTKDFDFYDKQLKPRWKAESRAWLLTWNPDKWEWEGFEKDLARVQSGSPLVRRWACMSLKPRPGDDVWIVRLGSEPRVIFAHGDVVNEPGTGQHWNADRASNGDEASFVEIQIDDLRDPLGTSALPISELSEKLGSVQNWTPQQSGIEIKSQAAALLEQLWSRDVVEPAPFVGQNIFVFTAGNEDARAHLRDSIEAPVPLARALRTFPAEHHDQLRDIHARFGGLYAWGAIPGPQNTPRWNQMRPGDWVLCVYDHTYRYIAQVVARFDNEKFAKDVWQEDADGRTWSLMYFLTKPTPVQVPVASLSEYLNASYMGFFRIGDEKLKKISQHFGSTEKFISDRFLESFAEIPDGVTRQDVLDALIAIERGKGEAFGDSTGYDLIHEGRRYPPKRVMGLAARRILGRALKPSEFSGGEGSKCFRVLRDLGFQISPKDDQAGQSYFLIRLNAESPYADELGKNYHFTSTVPNHLKLREGGVVIVDRKAAQSPVLLGRGVLGKAQQSTEGTERQYNASFVSWTPLLPRSIPASVMKEMEGMEGYNKQHAIRPLTEAIYRRIIDELETPMVDIKACVDSFATKLQQCHASYGDRHGPLIRTFICSLAAKPFVLLTGLSGSGKTQLAIRFGQWLGEGRLLVAAVRPDWTGAEALFGYVDALKPVSEGAEEAWSVPRTLAFLLSAANDPENPYALVLDEMNLSHVERYFADALSGMESNQPCLPNLALRPDGIWRRKSGGSPYIPFPKNVYVIGTVNVDETTYMFSPKVLDRANTFEFRVSAEDLSIDIQKPMDCPRGELALVRGLLSATRNQNWHLDNKYEHIAVLDKRLRQLHEILANYDLEFGHRVFYEANRFAAFHSAAGDGDVSRILDRILMQKILPRLHGSRRKLEAPLLSLAHLAFFAPDAVPDEAEIAKLKLEELDAGNAVLPMSFDKIRRMVRGLRANQFASFTE